MDALLDSRADRSEEREGGVMERAASVPADAVKDIFISYASEDRLAAERLAEALRREGWSVWWDPDIPPGDVWDELIEQELAAVCCVVVLWSASSVQKQWVKAEAAEAAARGILVPALIEDVRPPLAFRQIEAARLCDWRGEVDHREFQQLLGTISRLVRARAPAAAAPAQRERAEFFPHERARRPPAGRGLAEAQGPPPPRPPPSRPAAEASASRTRTLPLQLPGRSPRWRTHARIAALVLLGGVCGFFAREAFDLAAGRPRAGTQAINDGANPLEGPPPARQR